MTCLNINANPPFINIILTITHASPAWIGFDNHFDHENNMVKVNGKVLKIAWIIFRSLEMGGRGTVM